MVLNNNKDDPEAVKFGVALQRGICVVLAISALMLPEDTRVTTSSLSHDSTASLSASLQSTACFSHSMDSLIEAIARALLSWPSVSV